MVRTVETAEKLYVVRGFLLFSRQGSVPAIGCQDCVAAEARSSAFRNLLLGWWSIPWGLLTPFAVLQNLFRSRRRVNRQGLAEVLASVGLSLDDLVVGSDGMTGQQRAIVGAVARILGQVVVHSGPTSKEWQLARQAVVDFSDGKLSPEVADQWLANIGTEVLPVGAPQREDLITDKRDRLVLLRVAVEVTLADGVLSSAERSALATLAARLRLTSSELDLVIASLADVGADGRAISPDVAQAFSTLGLDPGASAAEIRRAYKDLMLRSHPDLVEEGDREVATRKSAQINAAHDLLIGVG